MAGSDESFARCAVLCDAATTRLRGNTGRWMHLLAGRTVKKVAAAADIDRLAEVPGETEMDVFCMPLRHGCGAARIFGVEWNFAKTGHRVLPGDGPFHGWAERRAGIEKVVRDTPF